jgi:hypothetical protein
MKLLGAVLIGVVAAVSGLVLNLDRPFLTNQSPISQAVAAETLQVNPTADFTQKGLSKKPFRSLWNIFLVSVAIQGVIAPPNRYGFVVSDDVQGKCDHCTYVV